MGDGPKLCRGLRREYQMLNNNATTGYPSYARNGCARFAVSKCGCFRYVIIELPFPVFSSIKRDGLLCSLALNLMSLCPV